MLDTQVSNPNNKHALNNINILNKAAMLALYGMALPYTWMAWRAMPNGGATSSASAFMSPYPSMVIASVLIIICAMSNMISAKQQHLRSRTILDIIAGIVMVIATILLHNGLDRTFLEMRTLGSILGGISCAWMYARWGVFYLHANLREAIRLICISIATASIIKVCFWFLPDMVLFYCAIVLPVLYVMCCVTCEYSTIQNLEFAREPTLDTQEQGHAQLLAEHLKRPVVVSIFYARLSAPLTVAHKPLHMKTHLLTMS